jgi:hypothetical protein
MIASDTTRPSGSVTPRRDSRVGVIGLGHMGHAFAVNLVADIWLLGGFLLFDEAALGRFAPTRGRFEI